MHSSELVSRSTTRVLGECPEVLKRRAEPGHRFLGHAVPYYIRIYIRRSSCLTWLAADSGRRDDRAAAADVSWSIPSTEKIQMAESSSSVSIPELGMAAAGFASLLVVASLESPSDQLRQATRYFAVGIPIVIAGAFIADMHRRATRAFVRTGLWILRMACILVGDVGCGVGVYWVFRHVSSSSATLFLTVAITSWVAVGLLEMAVIRFGDGSRDTT